jgi:hypothetical protein
MAEKITTVEFPVPLKSSGGIIRQQEISFDVFKLDGHYRLRPCLTEDERRVANLPEQLDFTIENGKPVSKRGHKDGNFHVIQDAVNLLQKELQLV